MLWLALAPPKNPHIALSLPQLPDLNARCTASAAREGVGDGGGGEEKRKGQARFMLCVLVFVGHNG